MTFAWVFFVLVVFSPASVDSLIFIIRLIASFPVHLLVPSSSFLLDSAVKFLKREGFFYLSIALDFDIRIWRHFVNVVHLAAVVSRVLHNGRRICSFVGGGRVREPRPILGLTRSLVRPFSSSCWGFILLVGLLVSFNNNIVILLVVVHFVGGRPVIDASVHLGRPGIVLIERLVNDGQVYVVAVLMELVVLVLLVVHSGGELAGHEVAHGEIVCRIVMHRWLSQTSILTCWLLIYSIILAIVRLVFQTWVSRLVFCIAEVVARVGRELATTIRISQRRVPILVLNVFQILKVRLGSVLRIILYK